ncbi:Putative Strn3 protein [Rhizopus microsporus]|nr:Putative Strn3 protein [Rhizopus microsporus]
MKRVKMLEYALRQERKRYSDKEEDTDTRATTAPMIRNTPASSLEESSKDDNDTNIKLREKSKQLLKSCLEEINYLTTIPTKLPLTNALASTIDQTKFVRTDSPLPKGQSNQHTQKARRQAVQQSSASSSPKEAASPPKEELEELEVPANVDEVAMMNNMSRSPDNNKEMPHISITLNQLREAMDDHPQNQQKIWKTRVTIKGHLDSVRAVYFHPKEMIAASGSDDGTVKIWNLKKVTGKDGNAGKKGSFEEADPSITFRGHTNIVTSLAISSLQNRVFSASLDSTIRVWKLPSEEWGPFSPVGRSCHLVFSQS